MANNLQADNHDFNAGIWQQTQDIYGPVTHVDVRNANTARLRRIEQARQADAPGWFQENVGGSVTEAGFYLTTMNDGSRTAPEARLDWMNYWFSKFQSRTRWLEILLLIASSQPASSNRSRLAST